MFTYTLSSFKWGLTFGQRRNSNWKAAKRGDTKFVDDYLLKYVTKFLHDILFQPSPSNPTGRRRVARGRSVKQIASICMISINSLSFALVPSACSCESCVGAGCFAEPSWYSNILTVQHDNGLHISHSLRFSSVFSEVFTGFYYMFIFSICFSRNRFF